MFFLLEPKMRRGFRKMLHVNEEKCRELKEEFLNLKEILNSREPGFEALAFACFIGIVIRLARWYPVVEEDADSPLFRMGKIISIMENSFTHPWTLAELAKRSCMSVNHFLRLFREATGRSPLSYLMQLRLRHAAGLLEKTDLTLSEIAERSGFYDSNYFCKQFRRHYQMTPRQYRLGNRQTEQVETVKR
jgi:AraC-like DNA-binding protein